MNSRNLCQSLVVLEGQVLTAKSAFLIYYLSTIYYYLLFKYCSVTLWLLAQQDIGEGSEM